MPEYEGPTEYDRKRYNANMAKLKQAWESKHSI